MTTTSILVQREFTLPPPPQENPYIKIQPHLPQSKQNQPHQIDQVIQLCCSNSTWPRASFTPEKTHIPQISSPDPLLQCLKFAHRQQTNAVPSQQYHHRTLPPPPICTHSSHACYHHPSLLNSVQVLSDRSKLGRADSGRRCLRKVHTQSVQRIPYNVTPPCDHEWRGQIGFTLTIPPHLSTASTLQAERSNYGHTDHSTSPLDSKHVVYGEVKSGSH